jgi:protein transport protein SEC24
MSNATDIDLAGISEDTSIGVELKLDGNNMTDNTYVQCAVLYTTPTGERRLRVHNLKLGVAKTVASLFKGADLDASICLLTKQFVTLSAKKSLGDLSKELDELCVKILLSYRKYVTPQASPAQLVLPETVKTLPLLLSSFKKSLVLRKGLLIKLYLF